MSVEEFKQAVQTHCKGKKYEAFPSAFKVFICNQFKTIDVNGKSTEDFIFLNESIVSFRYCGYKDESVVDGSHDIYQLHRFLFCRPPLIQLSPSTYSTFNNS